MQPTLLTKSRLTVTPDGTLSIEQQGQVVCEMHPSPAQLLALGLDFLAIASRQDPTCGEAAAEAIANTFIAQPDAGNTPCARL